MGLTTATVKSYKTTLQLPLLVTKAIIKPLMGTIDEKICDNDANIIQKKGRPIPIHLQN